MNYFELLLLELDLANDKNELSGFLSLLISQLKSHFEPKWTSNCSYANDVWPCEWHWSQNQWGATEKVLCPQCLFFTVGTSSALKIKSPLLDLQSQGSSYREIWCENGPLLLTPNYIIHPLCFTKTGCPFVLILTVGSEILNREERVRYQVHSTFLQESSRLLLKVGWQYVSTVVCLLPPLHPKRMVCLPRSR